MDGSAARCLKPEHNWVIQHDSQTGLRIDKASLLKKLDNKNQHLSLNCTKSVKKNGQQQQFVAAAKYVCLICNLLRNI